MRLEEGSTLTAKCVQAPKCGHGAKGTTRTYFDGCAISFRPRDEGIGREVTVLTVSEPQQGSVQRRPTINSNRAVLNTESHNGLG